MHNDNDNDAFRYNILMMKLQSIRFEVLSGTVLSCTLVVNHIAVYDWRGVVVVGVIHVLGFLKLYWTGRHVCTEGRFGNIFCKQRFRVTRKSRFSAKFRNHNANPVQLLEFFPAGPWGFPCSENQKLAQSLRCWEIGGNFWVWCGLWAPGAKL